MHYKSSINLERVIKRLQIMAEIGSTSAGGVNRLALTDEDRDARHLFSSWCENLGCSITIDNMGNQFAWKKGSDPELPAIMIFSHLDSQPSGGKYDGVLGVIAGIEVIERLQEENISHKHSIVIVNWTNEEGSRFSPAMLGSGVFSGVFDTKFAYSRSDKNEKKLGDELKRIGFAGKPIREKQKFKACFELHIEQGPLLDAANTPIGIVTGVQGIRWYKIRITGLEMHAGTIPMNMRNDPAQILPEILAQIYNLANKYGKDSRVTVGSIKTEPDSINTVPRSIVFTTDIRHPDKEELNNMHHSIQDICALKSKVEIKLEEIWHSEPIVFHDICINAIKEAANKLKLPAQEIVSGAGHDAAYINRIAPTGMIFIPCKDGISHNEAEHAEEKDIQAGISVLYEAVKTLM